jgi:hypothetical protein
MPIDENVEGEFVSVTNSGDEFAVVIALITHLSGA